MHQSKNLTKVANFYKLFKNIFSQSGIEAKVTGLKSLWSAWDNMLLEKARSHANCKVYPFALNTYIS